MKLTLKQQQIALESSQSLDRETRERRVAAIMFKLGMGSKLSPVQKVTNKWFTPLRDEIAGLQFRDTGKHVDAESPVFQLIHADKLTAITLHCISNEFLAWDYVQRTIFARALGKLCITELARQCGYGELKNVYYNLVRKFRGSEIKAADYWRRKSGGLAALNVRHALYVKTGARLLKAAYTAMKLESGEPVLVPSTRKGVKYRMAVIEMHPTIYAELQAASRKKRVERGHGAMIVRPRKWGVRHNNKQHFWQGGNYLVQRSGLLGQETKYHQIRAWEHADLTPMFESLHRLSGVQWKLHARMVDLLRETWDMGRPLFHQREQLPYPESGSERYLVGKENRRRKSFSVSIESSLTEAAKFAQYDPIYFPHHTDVRGRVYPMGHSLTFQGYDATVAMLQFSRAVPLGNRGQWQLAIHAANLWGVGKVSYADRFQWVKDNAGDIERTARDPLSTVEWWKNASKPFQFVAACIGLCDDKVAPHSPIQIDGSCNIGQHCAALARDEETATLVNLIEAPRPRDIYQEIATAVKSDIEASDFENRHELMELCTRSICKPSIMAQLFLGMDQGACDGMIEAMGKDTELSFASRTTAAYAIHPFIKLHFAAKAPAIVKVMLWIKEVCRACRVSVPIDKRRCFRWTSPMGFPIVMGKIMEEADMVRTCMGSWRVNRQQLRPRPSTREAPSAPPFFIAGMEACHMHRTAMVHISSGHDFASKHDCYFTHAADVDQLQSTTAAEFERLYETDWLQRYRDECGMRYPDAKLPAPFQRGTWDMVGPKPYMFA